MITKVLVASVVGLAVAFAQALTQVQDQTIAFGVKLLAAMLAGYSGGAAAMLFLVGCELVGIVAGLAAGLVYLAARVAFRGNAGALVAILGFLALTAGHGRDDGGSVRP